MNRTLFEDHGWRPCRRRWLPAAAARDVLRGGWLAAAAMVTLGYWPAPLFGNPDPRTEVPPPIATRLDVLSIHVESHAAFDAVFRLLADDLRLPKVFGALSRPEQAGRTLYARFSVGNAHLEPCGPYADDAPFAPPGTARFHGLTFQGALPLPLAATELDRRRLRHAGVVPPSDRDPHSTRFLSLREPELVNGARAVGLWEVRRPGGLADLRAVKPEFTGGEGGVLGVIRMEEVWVGGYNDTTADRWQRFLERMTVTDAAVAVGNGPALRFLRGGENDVRAIVLKVSSLSAATQYLQNRRWLGSSDADTTELDPARTCGLRVILRE